MSQAKKLNPPALQDTDNSAGVTKPPAAVTPKARGFFWFVASGEILKGPYSTTELKKLIAQEQIPIQYFAWRDGFSEWRPLYGIAEFAPEKPEKKDPSYPRIPTPGKQRAPQNLQEKKAGEAPVYRVKFHASRMAGLRKSEVLGIFIITLIFSYAVLEFAVRRFEKQWDQRWGQKVSGFLQNVGTQPDALPIEFYSSLLSAPGLQYEDEDWVPVSYEGAIARETSAHVGSFNVISSLPVDKLIENAAWDGTRVYERRARIEGLVNLKQNLEIRVELPGQPFKATANPFQLNE